MASDEEELDVLRCAVLASMKAKLRQKEKATKIGSPAPQDDLEDDPELVALRTVALLSKNVEKEQKKKEALIARQQQYNNPPNAYNQYPNQYYNAGFGPRPPYNIQLGSNSASNSPMYHSPSQLSGPPPQSMGFTKGNLFVIQPVELPKQPVKTLTKAQIIEAKPKELGRFSRFEGSESEEEEEEEEEEEHDEEEEEEEDEQDETPANQDSSSSEASDAEDKTNDKVDTSTTLADDKQIPSTDFSENLSNIPLPAESNANDNKRDRKQSRGDSEDSRSSSSNSRSSTTVSRSHRKSRDKTPRKHQSPLNHESVSKDGYKSKETENVTSLNPRNRTRSGSRGAHDDATKHVSSHESRDKQRQPRSKGTVDTSDKRGISNSESLDKRERKLSEKSHENNTTSKVNTKSKNVDKTHSKVSDSVKNSSKLSSSSNGVKTSSLTTVVDKCELPPNFYKEDNMESSSRNSKTKHLSGSPNKRHRSRTRSRSKDKLSPNKSKSLKPRDSKPLPRGYKDDRLCNQKSIDRGKGRRRSQSPDDSRSRSNRRERERNGSRNETNKSKPTSPVKRKITQQLPKLSSSKTTSSHSARTDRTKKKSNLARSSDSSLSSSSSSSESDSDSDSDSRRKRNKSERNRDDIERERRQREIAERDERREKEREQKERQRRHRTPEVKGSKSRDVNAASSHTSSQQPSRANRDGDVTKYKPHKTTPTASESIAAAKRSKAKRHDTHAITEREKRGKNIKQRERNSKNDKNHKPETIKSGDRRDDDDVIRQHRAAVEKKEKSTSRQRRSPRARDTATELEASKQDDLLRHKQRDREQILRELAKIDNKLKGKQRVVSKEGETFADSVSDNTVIANIGSQSSSISLTKSDNIEKKSNIKDVSNVNDVSNGNTAAVVETEKRSIRIERRKRSADNRSSRDSLSSAADDDSQQPEIESKRIRKTISKSKVKDDTRSHSTTKLEVNRQTLLVVEKDTVVSSQSEPAIRVTLNEPALVPADVNSRPSVRSRLGKPPAASVTSSEPRDLSKDDTKPVSRRIIRVEDVREEEATSGDLRNFLSRRKISVESDNVDTETEPLPAPHKLSVKDRLSFTSGTRIGRRRDGQLGIKRRVEVERLRPSDTVSFEDDNNPTLASYRFDIDRDDVDDDDVDSGRAFMRVGGDKLSKKKRGSRVRVVDVKKQVLDARDYSGGGGGGETAESKPAPPLYSKSSREMMTSETEKEIQAVPVKKMKLKRNKSKNPEDKERELEIDAKIRKIQEKNLAIEQRRKQIDEERQKFS